MKYLQRLLAGIAALVAPLPAFAVDNPFTRGAKLAGEVGEKAGIKTSRTLPEIIGSIINVFLGFLGIIFLVLLLYAGFLWMTAQGEPKQVEKAKEILKQSIIGLIIIVAAFAISNFVLTSLVNVSS